MGYRVKDIVVLTQLITGEALDRVRSSCIVNISFLPIVASVNIITPELSPCSNWLEIGLGIVNVTASDL